MIRDDGGTEALEAIPGVGRSIAAALAEMVRTGRWAYLNRLRGAAEPEDLFCAVPGIGPALAKRLHEALHVETLEQLEAAVREPAAKVPGIGIRRLALLRAVLNQTLSRIRRAEPCPTPSPSVDMLPQRRRRVSGKGEHGRVAPHRAVPLQPVGRAWLPILHTERDGWHFTALFSNTARAHDLGKTRDWVVLYFHADSGGEAQRTVVTESRGSLASRRVVRGRERECLAFYEQQLTD